MGLFSKGKDRGRITEDQPELDGRVTVRIGIDPVSRQEKDVSIIVIEQMTDDTVFKSDYKDRSSKGDYHAYVKAEELVRQFCRNENYVPSNINNNLKFDDMASIKTIEKRMR